MEITEQDIRNNPGVEISEIKEVKSHYHFHKLSSVTLSSHTLHCTFAVDLDPASIFYTPLENDAAPVREFDLCSVDGVDSSIEEKEVEIMPDALAVKVGDSLIPTVLIFASS